MSAKDLLEIHDRYSLAEYFGSDWNSLFARFLYAGPMSRHYKFFDIPKRGGGQRTISAPMPKLYQYQKKLHSDLCEVYKAPDPANAYIKNRGIVRNALPHVGAERVLIVDLKDFFPSIHFGRVRGLFMAQPFKFQQDVATALAHLCCVDGALPQGAPTSTVISNMLCRSMDIKLQRFAMRSRCQYTRYADDITISGKANVIEKLARRDTDVIQICSELANLIGISGFVINEKKTRVMHGGHSKRITGIVVNEKLNIPRERVHLIRAMLHSVQRYGIDVAEAKFKELVDNRVIVGVRTRSLGKYLGGYLRHMQNVRGRYDILVQKYQSQYNHAFPDGSILFQIDPDPSDISENCFVLETFSERQGKLEPRSQGTVFKISDCLFVTCAHCIGKNNYIFRPGRTSIRAWLVVKDLDVDLAIFRVAQETRFGGKGLALSSRIPNVGDEVTVYGFPRYTPGATMAVTSSRVSQTYIHFGRSRYRVSNPIVSGNSGGPVLNLHRQVIGIAATGALDFDANADKATHGIISGCDLQLFLHKYGSLLRRIDGSWKC